MYTVKVTSSFSSAHNLRGYRGKCEEVHGHNWKVEVSVSSEKLGDTGMVMDFTDLKSALKDALEPLDHAYLNEIEAFAEINPTSENIARYIYEKMSVHLGGSRIAAITVYETETSSATYSP